MKNIKLNEFKNADDFLKCFPNIKMGEHKLNIDYLDEFLDISSSCIDYLLYCTENPDDKITLEQFIGRDKYINISEEILNIIIKTSKDLNDLVNFRIKSEIDEENLTNRELNKLDKNKYILLYNYGITSKYIFNSYGEYEDFKLLCNTYVVHLLIKDKKMEFPLKILMEKYNIKSKKIARYFLKKQSYIKKIINEKIKNNDPCIFNLIRDLYYAIKRQDCIDEYGNIHIDNIPDSQLTLIDYIYKNFRSREKKKKRKKLTLKDAVKKSQKDPKKIEFLKEMWNLK